MSDLVCPSGHRVPVESVGFEGDDQRPQCPVCKALGVTTTESGWRRAGQSVPPPPATHSAPPPAAESRPRGVRWFITTGLALAAGGLFVFVRYSATHSVCASTVGSLEQLGSAKVLNDCTVGNVGYYGGLAALLVGLVLIVTGVIRRG